jgi:transposase
LFQDESHLMGGDIEGYVWGKTNQRVEVPVVNEREKQTYFGALDLVEGKVVVQAHEKGNTECQIAYLNFLMEHYEHKRLLILWDGASYHRSHKLREFLSELNEGLPESQWRIHCVRFAPNQPKQNPIEDVWLQAKNWLRQYSAWFSSFRPMKQLFELFFTLDVFDFPKIHMYGSFSKIK